MNYDYFILQNYTFRFDTDANGWHELFVFDSDRNFWKVLDSTSNKEDLKEIAEDWLEAIKHNPHA